MKKHYTLFLLNSSGSPVKSINFQKPLIFAGLLIIAMFFAGLGVGLYDYLTLREALPVSEKMADQLSLKDHTIVEQRKQIQSLARTINDLKTRMLSLNEFEKKVRVIANLDLKDDQESLFGMGGSMPEDLEPSLPLAEDHNQLLRQMHEQAEMVSTASAIQQEGFKSLLEKLQAKRNLLSSTPSIKPVSGWVTSRFGYRVSPFTGRKELHKGLDIASRKGTPIIAPADGMITFADSKGLMGNMLTIDHGYGMLTRYGHIDKFLKKAGEKVKRGDPVAMIGSTGRSTGPHLHYEVRLNGINVNPENYIIE
jgi:murein DD-endopeptidase MepM/ murein hydrolase activator NlpD